MLDFELLVYHAFKVGVTKHHLDLSLKNFVPKVISSPLIQDKEFEIVIDCTSYTTASEIPMQWFKYFIELVPSDIRERFRTAHLMNCNQAMQRFLRKLYNICSGKSSLLTKKNSCSYLRRHILYRNSNILFGGGIISNYGSGSRGCAHEHLYGLSFLLQIVY